MLERLTGRGRWVWSAFGKHPAAKDYFQINLGRPIAQALAQWVESGFEQVAPQIDRVAGHAWRFWLQGMKKGRLVCGLTKSSGDGVGRSYPLMLLGEGPLDYWPKRWHLLPAALAGTWDTMESIAVRRIPHIGRLEAELTRMRAPKPDWKEMMRVTHEDLNPADPQASKAIIGAAARERADELKMQRKLTIGLEQGERNDMQQLTCAWTDALRPFCSAPPKAVFMGGSLQRSFVVFFDRPLVTDDFVQLWSA